jgi:hypothetical protein
MKRTRLKIHTETLREHSHTGRIIGQTKPSSLGFFGRLYRR